MIMRFVRWIKWLKAGKPYKQYSGFSCGCCGKYWYIPFRVPTHLSDGTWWDTWGFCPVIELCTFSTISKYTKKAVENLWNGKPYKTSTTIKGNTAFGYGEIDDYGYWEYALRKAWIDTYKEYKKNE